MASKNSISVPPPPRNSSKSAAPSPLHSPVTTTASLDAQHNITLDNLPRLPDSTATSPAVSVAPLPRSSQRSRSTRSTTASDEETQHQPLQATVEEESYQGGEPVRANRPRDRVPDQLVRSEGSILSSSPPAPKLSLLPTHADLALTQSPERRHRSTPSHSPSISRAGTAYPHPHSPTPLHYPYHGPHPAAHSPQVYQSPGPVYAPSGSVPHYYSVSQPVALPPSLVSHHHHQPSYSPQYQSTLAAYHSAARVPLAVNTMSASPLERHASVGSRTSMPADVPPPPSALGSIALVEQGEALDPDVGVGPVSNDDPQELTQRIQSTMSNMANMTASLPDLHQLLSLYRETQSQLSLRNELNRRTESQLADLLRQKEQHIEALGKQLESVEAKHSAETSKLRLEVGNLDEKHRELLDQIGAVEGAKVEAEIARSGQALRNADLLLEVKQGKERVEKEKINLRKATEEIGQLKQETKDLTDENEKLKQDLKQVQDTMDSDMDNWKKVALEESMVEKEAMRKAFEDQLKERDGHIEGLRTEMNERLEEQKNVHLEEKSALESAFTSKQTELEQGLTADRNRWKQERDSLDQDIQREREKLVLEREKWHQDHERLEQEWQVERERLIKDWDDKYNALNAEAEQAMQALKQQLAEMQEQFAKIEQERDAAIQARSDLDHGWEKERAKSVATIGKIQNIASVLEKEKGRLQRLIETSGPAIDIKSKGDTF